MKRTAAALLGALIVLLSSGPTWGRGDWHSAGNAPVAPHIPKGSVNYECAIEVSGYRGDESFGEYVDAKFETKDFQEYGSARFETKNLRHAALNNQSISLRFTKNADGSEQVHLTVTANLQGSDANYSTFRTSSAPRADGRLDAEVHLSGSPKKRGAGQFRSINVKASCVGG